MTVVRKLSEKRVQAFIFDMDGVIIDSEPIHSRVKMETFRHFGIDFDESRLSSYMGGTSGLIFKDVVAESGRRDITPEMLTDYKHKHYLEILQSGGIDPVEGTRELIRALHEAGVPLGLATSSHPPVMNAILDNFEIRKYFTSVISGGELPESKPNPAIYLISAERLGARPEHCCVLEDTTNGIMAAKRAGMYCIAFHNPHSGEQDLSLADRVVEKIAEIDVEELLSLPLGTAAESLT